MATTFNRVLTCSPKSAHNRIRFSYSGGGAEHVEEQAQIIAALKQVEAGRKAEDVAREQGVSKHTIYAWKAKYGGMDVSEAQEAKQLRDENTRLRKLVADLSLDKEALQSVIRKHGWSS
jgi:putative transposase